MAANVLQLASIRRGRLAVGRAGGKEIVSEEKDKIHDEQTLAKVLEAAYVLQEHNRELRNQKADPKLMRDQLVAEHELTHPAAYRKLPRKRKPLGQLPTPIPPQPAPPLLSPKSSRSSTRFRYVIWNWRT